MMEGWKVGKWKGSVALAIAAIALSNFPTFQRSALAQDSIPPGYGTLKRDEIVVRFTTATVEIQFLPLDEQVIRLLARDTYRSLVQLVQSRQFDITVAAERAVDDHPTQVLVTFFALATATAMVVRAPLLDRLVLVVSAIPIAVIANITRITATT